MKRLLLWLIALSWVADLSAQSGTCFICSERMSGGTIYGRVDGVTFKQEFVCESCARLTDLCFACGMPVRPGSTSLPDGRSWCDRDAKTAVLNQTEAQRVCADAAEQLTRALSRFITFPFPRSTVSVMDRIQIETMFKSPGADRDCPYVYGFIRTDAKTNAPPSHVIHVLVGLTRARTQSSLAHEITHAWMNEHVTDSRQLGRDAAEGFCELVAYRLMEHLGEAAEMGVIRSNNYTRGQFELLRQAEDKHGFYTVANWIKAGEDTTLLADDLDRVRLTRTPVTTAPPPAPATLAPPASAPRPAPDTLQLKGIIGGGDRRRALINDRILAAGEEGKVRVGTTNVVVKCLEIRADSALIQVAGTDQKQELRLPAPLTLDPPPLRPDNR